MDSSRRAWRCSRRRGPVLAVLVLAAFWVGCKTTDVAPHEGKVDPTALSLDESFIWAESVDAQEALDRSGLLVEDDALSPYLQAVATRVVGDELRRIGLEPQVHVLSNVDMNAFAFANAVVYVHTAMLARIENEAQLAALLAHEFSHSIHRHALRRHRDMKNKTAWMMSVGVVVGGVPLAPVLLQVGAVSSMLGYSRELEAEADEEGFARLAAAGYDLSEAPKLFEIMADYQRELEEQGISEPDVPYFFSTHPRMQERIEVYEELIEEHGGGPAGAPGLVDAEIYRARTRGVRLHQASLELAAGRFVSARVTAGLTIDHFPDDAAAWVSQGLAYAGEGQREEARRGFRRALEIDEELPEAHYALGMSFYREWRATPSRAAAETAAWHLDRYLALQPDAGDDGYVTAYLGELRGAVGPNEPGPFVEDDDKEGSP